MLRVLPDPLVRLAWSYLAPEEREFLRRWGGLGEDAKRVPGGPPELQRLSEARIAIVLGRSGWMEALVAMDADPDIMLKYAAYAGCLSTMTLAESRGANKLELALAGAAGHGQLDAITLLESWGAKDFNCATYVAASFGRLDVLWLLKKTGDFDPEEVLRAAARGGKIPLMKLAIRWGAKDFKRALMAAAAGNKVEAMKKLVALGVETRFAHSAALSAASHGHVEAIQYLARLVILNPVAILVTAIKLKRMKVIVHVVERYGDGCVPEGLFLLTAVEADFLEGMKFFLGRDRNIGGSIITAARFGRLNFIALLLESKVHYERSDIVYAAQIAAQYGHLDFIKFLESRGFVTDFDRMLATAALYGRTEVMQYAVERGASDFNRALIEAARGQHSPAIKLLHWWGATNLPEALERTKNDHLKEGIVDLLIALANTGDP